MASHSFHVLQSTKLEIYHQDFCQQAYAWCGGAPSWRYSCKNWRHFYPVKLSSTKYGSSILFLTIHTQTFALDGCYVCCFRFHRGFSFVESSEEIIFYTWKRLSLHIFINIWQHSILWSGSSSDNSCTRCMLNGCKFSSFITLCIKLKGASWFGPAEEHCHEDSVP